MSHGLALKQITLWCCLLSPVVSLGQAPANYDVLVQQGKAQLQAGSNDLALTTANSAIKLNRDRWGAYALAGGALMNLKRYEEAADDFSEAIKLAPEAKQQGLRDLRKQCLFAESGVSSNKAATPAQTTATTQAEVVLWKSIENSTNPADFQTYLNQYPQGAFAALAQRHLDEMKAQAQREQLRLEAQANDERRKQIAALTWVDPSTGLWWARVDTDNKEAVEQAQKSKNYQAAINYCAKLSLVGYTDWRLPSRSELEKIYPPGSAWKVPQIGNGLNYFNVFTVLWTNTASQSGDGHVAIANGKEMKVRDNREGFSKWRLNSLCVRRPEVSSQ